MYGNLQEDTNLHEAATPTSGHFESRPGGPCGLHEGIAWGGPGAPHGGIESAEWELNRILNVDAYLTIWHLGVPENGGFSSNWLPL